MSDEVNIKGIDKSELFAALYDRAKAQGRGFEVYTPAKMSMADARQAVTNATEAISGRIYFDYHNGRVMKVELSGDTLDPWGYDRDNGGGAVQAVVDSLKEGGK